MTDAQIDSAAAAQARLDREAEPPTGTREIDWLSSRTEIRTYRTKRQPDETTVEHYASFGITPGHIEDLAEGSYGSARIFQPEFLSATWRNGALSSVSINGPLRLKAGGTSDKISCRCTTHGYWRSNPLNREVLPAKIREALAAYETAVAVDSGAHR